MDDKLTEKELDKALQGTCPKCPIGYVVEIYFFKAVESSPECFIWCETRCRSRGINLDGELFLVYGTSGI